MKSQQCKNCRYYSAYYKQWYSHYGKLTHGHCKKHKQAQKETGTCDSFIIIGETETIEKTILLDSLKQALKSINDIAQILNEKKDRL